MSKINKVQPIGKFIIVKEIEEEIKTSSGLLLSAQDSNEFRYKKATVIKSGTDVDVIKEGDIIHYDKGHSFKMVIHEDQYTIIQERDVVVVL
jgi:co-chaperonin GroES (HSP10)